MQKPFGIQLTTLLMACSLVLDLVMAETRPLPAAFSQGMFLLTSNYPGIGAFLVAAFKFIFIVAYANGMNWVRWAVMAYSLIYIVSLRWTGSLWDYSHLDAGFDFFKACLGLFLMVYLNLPATKRWFAEETRRKRSRPPLNN